MLKKTFAAVAALALLTATPALAQNSNFTGVRAEVHASVSDYSRLPSLNEIGYAGVVGVDVPLGSAWTVGAELEAANLFDNEGRELGVAARMGYALNDSTLVFGRVGYAHLDDVLNRNFEGPALGAGIQWNISDRTHLTTQYRFTDYNQGADSHTVSIGLGLRF